MKNKEFGILLEKRTMEFACEIIRFSASLPFSPEAKVIRNQIAKSGTSIGANYREANRSRSKADFTNKIKICESEANETLYWLEVLMGLKWGRKEQIEKLNKESKEFLAIFTSIVSKIKSH